MLNAWLLLKNLLFVKLRRLSEPVAWNNASAKECCSTVEIYNW